jgi:hypothetical protein
MHSSGSTPGIGGLPGVDIVLKNLFPFFEMLFSMIAFQLIFSPPPFGGDKYRSLSGCGKGKNIVE